MQASKQASRQASKRQEAKNDGWMGRRNGMIKIKEQEPNLQCLLLCFALL
jgi:hypothetical protein